jgi:hypothetical protein
LIADWIAKMWVYDIIQLHIPPYRDTVTKKTPILQELSTCIKPLTFRCPVHSRRTSKCSSVCVVKEWREMSLL